jgi:hypothetical protein
VTGDSNVSRLKLITGRKCRECLQTVPSGARLCPNCKAYQDWRRFMAIGQTNLALLVALFSVLTTLAAVIPPLLRSRDADIKLLFAGNSSDQSATFLARNNGRSGGIVRISSLIVSNDLGGMMFDGPQHDAQYIQADREVQLSVKPPSDFEDHLLGFVLDHEFIKRFGPIDRSQLQSPYGIMSIEFIDYAKSFRCQFIGNQTSFYTSSRRVETTVPCWDLEWARLPLQKVAHLIAQNADRK